jgi:copper(I)-binding protein
VKDKNGMVQVQNLSSMPLPPKSETVLAPGALELQLVGLTQALKDGLELPLTLKFSDGTVRTLRIEVEGD